MQAPSQHVPGHACHAVHVGDGPKANSYGCWPQGKFLSVMTPSQVPMGDDPSLMDTWRSASRALPWIHTVLSIWGPGPVVPCQTQEASCGGSVDAGSPAVISKTHIRYQYDMYTCSNQSYTHVLKGGLYRSRGGIIHKICHTSNRQWETRLYTQFQ